MAIRYKFSKDELQSLKQNLQICEAEVETSQKHISTLKQKQQKIKEDFLKEQRSYRFKN